MNDSLTPALSAQCRGLSVDVTCSIQSFSLHSLPSASSGLLFLAALALVRSLWGRWPGVEVMVVVEVVSQPKFGVNPGKDTNVCHFSQAVLAVYVLIRYKLRRLLERTYALRG